MIGLVEAILEDSWTAAAIVQTAVFGFFVAAVLYREFHYSDSAAPIFLVAGILGLTMIWESTRELRTE